LIVRSGALTLVGPGATYQIQRLADRATVRVERGALRIEWIGGRAELRPGDTATFPTEAPPRPVAAPIPAEAAKEAPPVPPPPATQPQPQPPRAARAAPTPSIGEPPPLVVPADPVGALLAQADAARAAGRSEAAAALLERVGRDHPGDPRTPLAAFTLGRLLLEALDRPAQAAEAFARAWALDPRGALAEDALAREVESLAAAGDREGAKARALEYRRRYPKGSRIRVELE
jgi:TolA-binding protein